ncbi:MAG: hypothetical protein JSS02_02870 [Planctomycetes bacterium]|nr:hypothetical protein [Planctomycetota bacterium]
MAPTVAPRPHPRWLQGIIVFGILTFGAYSAWEDGLRDHLAAQNEPYPESPDSPVNRPSASPNSPADPSQVELAGAVGSQPADKSAKEDPDSAARAAAEKSTEKPKYKVAKVTLKDQRGKVIYSGPVDLTPTITRIHAGTRLSFPHDGVVFQNRERRLPRQERDYYHEYVHPTDGVKGPGPQRIVTGKNGEIYYTFDHYNSFLQWDDEHGWTPVKSK